MMEWTDRHCRFFHRLLTRRTLIYTEMITTGAVLHGDRARLLAHDPAEHPVALQLGGCDPRQLALCARIAADFGYDEINLNVGCPSDRVQEGRFGACLMAEPGLVGECVAAMKASVEVPVTVKCRVGIDEQDPEEALEALTRAVEEAGVAALIVHARKAWLQGLSPRENRDLPPLDYDRVRRLKAAHPRLVVVLNGGIASLEQAAAHLDRRARARMRHPARRHHPPRARPFPRRARRTRLPPPSRDRSGEARRPRGRLRRCAVARGGQRGGFGAHRRLVRGWAVWLRNVRCN